VTIGPIRVDWFGWSGRKSGPTGGPRWFISRGANFKYIALGGICSVTVPWFMFHGFIESRGWDAGWRAGFEAGRKSAVGAPGGGDKP